MNDHELQRAISDLAQSNLELRRQVTTFVTRKELDDTFRTYLSAFGAGVKEGVDKKLVASTDAHRNAIEAVRRSSVAAVELGAATFHESVDAINVWLDAFMASPRMEKQPQSGEQS